MFPPEKRRSLLLVVTVGLSIGTCVDAAERPIAISDATRDPNGFLVHTALSPFQPGPTEIRVLLPIKQDTATRCPVVYVLPVEAGNAHLYGDGLVEIQSAGSTDSSRRSSSPPPFRNYPGTPTTRAIPSSGRRAISSRSWSRASNSAIRPEPIATDVCSWVSASQGGAPTACFSAIRTNSARRPPGMLP